MSCTDTQSITATMSSDTTAVNSDHYYHHSASQEHNRDACGPASSTISEEQSCLFEVHRQNYSSSKLPAFRLSDRQSTSGAVASGSHAGAALPSPISPNHNEPLLSASSPVTEDSDTPGSGSSAAATAAAASAASPSASSLAAINHNNNFNDPSRHHRLPPSPLSDHPDQESEAPQHQRSRPPLSPRIRSSTYDKVSTVNRSTTSTAQCPDNASRTRRPTSLPDSPSHRDSTQQQSTATAPASTRLPRERSQHHPLPTRAPTSRSSSDSLISEGYLTSRSRQRVLAAVTDKSTKEGASGRRELLLPKTLSQTSPPNDRRDSGLNRPPVSYKPPIASATQTAPSTPVRVPPIRGFRSSFSRKSIDRDMNFSRPFDMNDQDDPNHDHSLRALEGRRSGEQSQLASPAVIDDADDGDMFLRIARQESGRRGRDGSDVEDNQSSVSRVLRTSHRRPMSTNHATYNPISPPQLTRRLSDQESSRPRRINDDRSADAARASTLRSLSRDKAASAHPLDDTRTRQSPSSRPSPLVPLITARETSALDGTVNRRRPSISEVMSPSTRTPTFKSYNAQSYAANSKSYNSSPLVRSYDYGHNHTQERGQEHGTESTLSTAAPSTVWDELDDIRTRINRLELTGKLPSTSGAAVSRLSDERPATATTTVTTVSSSPKRQDRAGVAQTEVGSTTSSHAREAHPVLHTALTRTKAFLNPEVYRALEAAANDAMALSTMMGSVGQPGPISSGQSTIGPGSTVTDRQLRRKANSVCRNLTELCVALGEDVHQAKQQNISTAQTEGSATPVGPAPSSVVTSQRRPSVHELSLPDPTSPSVSRFEERRQTLLRGERRPSMQESSPAAEPTSPRVSKLEERRHTLLNGSLLPSPRVGGSVPASPADTTPNRRSSLLIGRTRRAGTEEPDEGRASSIMRARRTGTEEPEEGRRTSLFIRNRRGTIGDDEPESKLRTPSRAITEVNTARTYRDYSGQAPPAQDNSAAGQSALPRRRLPSSATTSRLAHPATVTTTTPPARRYLERSIPAEEPAYTEVASSRRVSMIGSGLPARNASISSRRENRDSTLTSISTAATAGGESY